MHLITTSTTRLCDGLNNAEKKLANARAGDYALVNLVARARPWLRHFSMLSFGRTWPDGRAGRRTEGRAGEQIKKILLHSKLSKKHYSGRQSAVEGSGWAVWPGSRKASNWLSSNRETPAAHAVGVVPCSCWMCGNAYYLKYQNKRAAYVEAGECGQLGGCGGRFAKARGRAARAQKIYA